MGVCKGHKTVREGREERGDGEFAIGETLGGFLPSQKETLFFKNHNLQLQSLGCIYLLPTEEKLNQQLLTKEKGNKG